MPSVLRFGIASLDELLGYPSEKSEREIPPGIYLPQEEQRKSAEATSPANHDDVQDSGKKLFTTSVCIIGPTGTGKSIFGLHMASTYLADCLKEQRAKATIELPAVLYVSTDLTYNMAFRAWSNFALNYPFARRDPFHPELKRNPPDFSEIPLRECNPIDLAENFALLQEERGKVIFVDMAAYTAGDDWGFLHKLLSLLPAPPNDPTQPRHLIAIDAIEGFEALAGELNAFGEKSSRRSRIAQVMRLISGKCHALLVVEQSKDRPHNESLAEEFVADTVIRLDSISTRNYERRVLKVEKVRGQSHIRGQHHYSIRSGNGSTTGRQVNPDDPKVPTPAFQHEKTKEEAAAAAAAQRRLELSPPRKPEVYEATILTETSKPDEGRQSYVQVFHSVHRISRKIMEESVEERFRLPETFNAAFGIPYLDNMLAGQTETTRREEANRDYLGYFYDTRGLPCRSITSLIGDSLTQKSTLGKAFLSRCFSQFDQRLQAVTDLLEAAHGNEENTHALWSKIHRKVLLLSDSSNPVSSDFEKLCKHYLLRGGPADLIDLIEKVVGAGSIVAKEDRLNWRDSVPALITNLAGWLLDYQTGAAVMLVTHNTHFEELARQFIGWLHTETQLKELNRRRQGYEQALRNYIKGGTICRRLEIHSLSSEILVHIVKQAVHAGQRKILTPLEIQNSILRYKSSWPVRVVIDDFSSLRNIFPELREDPLLFPSILFHFEREGVTTLIVDTQSGKPETTIAERFETELRQMVHHHLYTWRVPFYGESRVAITAIPPLSHEYAGIVRELRWESESVDRHFGEPATVDPHFELYAGLEEGKPEPVPLHARFYAESPAVEKYIALENSFLSEMFACYAHPALRDPTSIIFGMVPPGYSDLRALAYLQKDTRLGHTFLFQIDEFWAMRAPGRHKRAGAFQPQRSYLNAITANVSRDSNRDLAIGPSLTAEDYVSNPNEDPYELFQLRKGDPLPRKPDGTPSNELRRRHFFQKYYQDFADPETLEPEADGLVDRVPFSWDFGFLLCKKKAWDSDRKFTIEERDGVKKELNVKQVWRSMHKAEYEKQSERDNLENPDKKENGKNKGKGEILNYVSWRMFFEACKKAAEQQSDELSKSITPFDFSQISQESFSTLILEMWFSEIYDSLKQRIEISIEPQKSSYKEELERIKSLASKRQPVVSEVKLGGNAKQKGRPADLGKPGTVKVAPNPLSLSRLLQDYWLELYKCWLILIEVINFSDIARVGTISNYEFKSRKADFSAIASRHWYKTATQCPDEISLAEPLVPVRLPGHFTARGDWFLAVSGGSRSIRQGERALDLLNSRRSNVTRLQMGIGLPTRESTTQGPNAVRTVERLRTKLISHEGGQDTLEYGALLQIGAGAEYGDKENFYWLWRSSLDDYANCNRIWHRWLNRTLFWWHRKLLRYRSRWRNSFEVYDTLNNDPPQGQEEFAPTNRAELKQVIKEVREARTAKKKQLPLDVYKAAYSVAQLKVRMGFLDLKNALIEELKQASDRDY